MKFLSALLFIFVSYSFLLSSCFNFQNKELGMDVNAVRPEAFVPIYSGDSGLSRVVLALPPRPILDAGKIYVQGDLLFQVEKLEGVHIINYADRTKPVKLGFIKSRGCSEVAYKNGYLVINNLDDLVFVDVRNPASVKESARIQHAFSQFYVEQYRNNHPPVSGKYYVCSDYLKGDVVDWKLEKNVKGANCFY
jgi:hypothetical protein